MKAKVETITFYQSVVVGKSGFNTIYEGQPETKGIAIDYLIKKDLIRISGAIGNKPLKGFIYVGMANVRGFVSKVDLGEEGPLQATTKPENLATKPVSEMSEEDQKIILTAAIKKLGKTPHPMTGIKRLKETLEELEGASKA